MDANLFLNQRAGKLISSSVASESHWAFVPNPLPPKLEFDSTLIAALSNADRALGELAGLGRMLPNPDLLVRPFLRKEAELSSKIEGTQSEIMDIYAYEAGGYQAIRKNAPPESDVREVLNYVMAMNYGMNRLNELPMSLRLIREIHARLMYEVRGNQSNPGEFRTSQNWIGAPGTPIGEADFIPPPAPQMNEALFAFEKYIHDGNGYPPLVRLALIHYQFEAIHPFRDGNGRIGRLILPLLMMQWGLLPAPLIYLSAFFEKRKDAYMGHLMQVSQKGAWEPWILFFLNGVTTQSQKSISVAKRFQDLQTEWRRRLTDRRSSANLIRLVEILFDTPLITAPLIEKRLGITYPSAKSNIDKLVKAGVLSPFGPLSYGKAYIAQDIYDAISS